MSFNTPTYSYAYKYAAFDGLRRLAATNQGARDATLPRAADRPTTAVSSMET